GRADQALLEQLPRDQHRAGDRDGPRGAPLRRGHHRDHPRRRDEAVRLHAALPRPRNRRPLHRRRPLLPGPPAERPRPARAAARAGDEPGVGAPEGRRRPRPGAPRAGGRADRGGPRADGRRHLQGRRPGRARIVLGEDPQGPRRARRRDLLLRPAGAGPAPQDRPAARVGRVAQPGRLRPGDRHGPAARLGLRLARRVAANTRLHLQSSAGRRPGPVRGLMSRAKRGLELALLAFSFVYLIAIIVGIVVYKALFIKLLLGDPFFAVYGLSVAAYILSRFVLSLFYRPGKHQGLEPHVAI